MISFKLKKEIIEFVKNSIRYGLDFEGKNANISINEKGKTSHHAINTDAGFNFQEGGFWSEINFGSQSHALVFIKSNVTMVEDPLDVDVNSGNHIIEESFY